MGGREVDSCGVEWVGVVVVEKGVGGSSCGMGWVTLCSAAVVEKGSGRHWAAVVAVGNW